MSKRLTSLAILLIVAMLFVLLPAASASAASPWWQVLTGSRPTNLWTAGDNVQEIESEVGEFAGFEGLAATIEVGGQVVGCLGTANFAGTILCEGTGFPPDETAAELQATLESAFAAPGAVEVSGGPAGGEPFRITTVGRGAPTIVLSPMLGSASAKVISKGGSGHLVLTITNLGSAPVDGTTRPVTITDELPTGVVATGFEAFAGANNGDGPVNCALETSSLVSCTFAGTLPSYEALEVEVFASLTGNPPSAGAPGEVRVSGGNAPAARAAQEIKVSPAQTPFGIEHFSVQAEEEGGAIDHQAGTHPFQLTTTVQLNSGSVTPGATRREAGVEQPALPRNLRFPLPAGLAGNATAVPECTMTDFLAEKLFKNDCPDSTAVGVASVTVIEHTLGFLREAVPVFNLPPAHGEPARFGFMAAGDPVMIDTSVDPSNKYRIVASVNNVTQAAQFLSGTVSLWGTPGDPRHDNARGWGCVYFEHASSCERPESLKEAPFLRQPVSCNSLLDFGLELEPWNVPIGSAVSNGSFTGESLSGCNRVPFDPSIAAAATSKLTTNPSGLDFELNLPNAGLDNPSQGAIAEAEPKKIVVDLPEGVTVNPSEAEGLAVCSEADFARETAASKPGEGCPEASKIGSVEATTPLLREKANGVLYLAAPYENPFNSLLALYLVAKVPDRGVIVKQAGLVQPDPRTGRLRTTFDSLPQLPYSTFKLHFREGGRAPLVTPPACGTYQTTAHFTPYSAANLEDPAPNEVVERTSSSTIERGTEGGACPSGGTPPFHPGLEAGTNNNAAGSYSPFYVHLSRTDSEQEITHFSIKLPPGVTGKLAGIPFCSDAGIAAARSRERTPHGGQEELDHPSCPQASEVGHTLVGAGVGQVLTYVPGKVYLAGPYNGSNLSVVAITAAKAGPFDLGTVVIREALKVNPETAEVSVDAGTSDPIPHIVNGIPVHLRDIRVYVDRPEFVKNPTNCEPTSTASTVLGSGTDFASEADDRPVTVTSRFQAADCANLGFKPKVKISLKGPTKRAGLPALTAVVTPRAGDANIGRAVVTLPPSEFLEQAHIGNSCTRVQFHAGGGNGERCPANSVLGHAVAITPLLDEPLQGPVFLRSNGGERKLPDLVAALHSKDIDIVLVGFINSLHKKGSDISQIRTTFAKVPDQPVTKFTLRMSGGKKGLLVNSTNLCKGTHKAISEFTGQNGKRFDTEPKVKAQCGKKHKGKKGGKAKKKGGTKASEGGARTTDAIHGR